MNLPDANSFVAAALSDRRLLYHPFYRRWEAGQVAISELADYASQYRHFESYLPSFLGELVRSLPEGRSRDLVAANLADELGDPVPHTELFERFARAVDAPQAECSPAMAALLDVHEDLLGRDALHALAGFLAYECQAAEVARAKADGLRTHYGLEDDAVSFWAHHAEVDINHALWARDALTGLTDAPGALEPSVRVAADAWWAFLDEREAQQAPAA